tara:strand:+ start:97 stop:327 length:231 start_codon:yes stop_codon:yes gene_type:complete
MTFLATLAMMGISLLVGGGLVFFLVRKYNKKQVEAAVAVEVSEANDEERTELAEKAQATIDKNQELIDKIKKSRGE